MESVLSSHDADNSSTTTADIDRPSTLGAGDNLTQGERVTFASLIGAMAVAAVTGNTLVCFTLLRVKMPARQFLINLAISDIMVGSLVMPFCVVTLLEGRWVFGPVMCEIVAFLKTGCLFSGALTLCVIAIDRYQKIKRLSYTMTCPQRAAGLLLPWLGSGLTATGPLLGWGDYKWSPVKPVCTVDWLHSPSYTLFCFISFGFLPEILISYWYLSIAIYVHQKKRNVRKLRAFAAWSHSARVSAGPAANSQACPAQQPGRVHISREEIGVLKTMAAVVFVFSTVAMPYIIMQLMSLRRDREFSLRAETISTALLYLGTWLNPLIYSGGSAKFRQELKKTLVWPFKALKGC